MTTLLPHPSHCACFVGKTVIVVSLPDEPDFIRSQWEDQLVQIIPTEAYPGGYMLNRIIKSERKFNQLRVTGKIIIKL